MKILSIGFHGGALRAIEQMLPVTESFLCPIATDGYHYNMSHDRAKMLWDMHKDYYNQFDVIITSDTAALSRIFLQNDFQCYLIIYVCNRIDYWDGAKTSEYPDPEYYELLRKAMSNRQVAIVGYTPYEAVYANKFGIYVEDTIKPALIPNIDDGSGLWSRDEVRDNLYYIPAYQNNETFRLVERCGLKTKTGRHSGLSELQRFKAILHLPYHWNGIANSEALSCATPYYVPSRNLMLKLCKESGYWFQNTYDLEWWIDICDFYDKRYSEWLYYFDSLDNIPDITPDYQAIDRLAERVYKESVGKFQNILDRWQK